MISAQTVVNQTLKALRSYHEAGLVDPGQFPEWIRKGLQDVGLESGSGPEIRLIVTHHKARLPMGLSRIDELYWEKESKADKPADLIPIYEIGYTPPSSGYHSKEPEYDTYTLKSGWIHLNQAEGILTLRYSGTPDPSSLPLIEDNPILIDYLKKTLVYNQLNDWYLNGEVANLERILGEAKLQYEMAFRNASYQEKLPSFSELVGYKRNRIRSLR